MNTMVVAFFRPLSLNPAGSKIKSNETANITCDILNEIIQIFNQNYLPKCLFFNVSNVKNEVPAYGIIPKTVAQ